MKVTTTFWSEEVIELDNLLYIHWKTKEIIYKANLNDKVNTYDFFKGIAKFVRSSAVIGTVNSNDSDNFYQFAVMYKGNLTPIKWFDLVVNDDVTVSHDIAFETTLIHKNELRIPFGKFPIWCKGGVKLPKYREFNIKAKAYGYMANQVRKCLF